MHIFLLPSRYEFDRSLGCLVLHKVFLVHFLHAAVYGTYRRREAQMRRKDTTIYKCIGVKDYYLRHNLSGRDVINIVLSREFHFRCSSSLCIGVTKGNMHIMM